jgi:hypothetical protein
VSCAPRHDAWARRAEVERLKQQQRAVWTAALTGAVSGAVNGARGTGPQVRIGDAERDSAVTALGEHYAAGRLTKDELDERMDAAWTARTSSDLAVLFHDLPSLQPTVPPRRRPSPEARRSWRTGVRLSWVFVLLVVLAAMTDLPWFVVAFFAFMWWSGMFHGLRRWSHHRR